jgi:hypothetical protein
MLDLGRLLLGLIILTVGVLYMLQGVGVLDAGEVIGDWWPAALIAVGITQLVERGHGALVPLLVIAAGTLLLLVTTGVIEGDVWTFVWPTLLIMAGLVAISRWAGAGSLPRDAGDDVVVATGVFGGPTIASTSRAFRGASLTAVFGGVSLDLRGAALSADGARITATAAFGGIEILVPRGWRLAVRGTPFFGGVEDATARDALPVDAPVCRIDALAAFGGVEIKHEP